MIEWIGKNWDKILAAVITITGGLLTLWRRFSGKITAIEHDVASLKTEIALLKAEVEDGKLRQRTFEESIITSLTRIQSKLDDVVELKIFVEKSDVLLNEIKDDVRELKEDVKILMRG